MGNLKYPELNDHKTVHVQTRGEGSGAALPGNEDKHLCWNRRKPWAL